MKKLAVSLVVFLAGLCCFASLAGAEDIKPESNVLYTLEDFIKARDDYQERYGYEKYSPLACPCLFHKKRGGKERVIPVEGYIWVCGLWNEDGSCAAVMLEGSRKPQAIDVEPGVLYTMKDYKDALKQEELGIEVNIPCPCAFHKDGGGETRVMRIGITKWGCGKWNEDGSCAGVKVWDAEDFKYRKGVVYSRGDYENSQVLKQHDDALDMADPAFFDTREGKEKKVAFAGEYLWKCASRNPDGACAGVAIWDGTEISPDEILDVRPGVLYTLDDFKVAARLQAVDESKAMACPCLYNKRRRGEKKVLPAGKYNWVCGKWNEDGSCAAVRVLE